ncbi:DUF5959 family protein [Streptomyces sp. NPDC058423]|uniref:DUF5959 family protein n=1 Tax=unclassified Streptomyces TaxID=2593676 RepID=UPI003656AF22
MDSHRAPEALELIRLGDGDQSVSVRLPSTTPVASGGSARYYAAEAVVISGFVSGTVHLGFDSDDLTDLGRLLDAIEEVEAEPDPDDPFTADWPREGDTACLRFIIEDPWVVEVCDGPSTGVAVAVPLDMGEGWIAGARERLAAARVALGE